MQIQIRRPAEQNREPRSEPHPCSQLIVDKDAENMNCEWGLSTKRCLENWVSHNGQWS